MGDMASQHTIPVLHPPTLPWRLSAVNTAKSQQFGDILLAQRGLNRKATDKSQQLLSEDLVHPKRYDELMPAIQDDLRTHMLDFASGAGRIAKAITTHQKIGIVADYDCDGNSSAALMLRMLKACGVPASQIVVHIPNRELEGYGINGATIDTFKKDGVATVIALDNGTTARGPIEKAARAGMDVVVIDHHPNGTLSLASQGLTDKVSIINAQRTDQKPVNAKTALVDTGKLAAAGMSYLVAAEVVRQLNEQGYFAKQSLKEPNPKDWLGLVALATIADVVPMDNTLNRMLVREGLRVINENRDPFFSRLKHAVSSTMKWRNMDQVSSEDIAFAFGPIVNAPGRLADSLAWLFLSDPQEQRSEHVRALSAAMERKIKDLETALKKKDVEVPTLHSMKAPSEDAYLQLALQSIDLNSIRKKFDRAIEKEAFAQAQEQVRDGSKVLVVAGKDWHEGVVGIVAGRLKELYQLPVVVAAIHENGTLAKASARSIKADGLQADIGEAIRTLTAESTPAANDTLLATGGGHAMAAGCSLRAPNEAMLRQKLDHLRTRLNDLLGPSVDHVKSHMRRDIAGIMNPSDLPERSMHQAIDSLIRQTDAAGPWGEGFRAPTIALKNVQIHLTPTDGPVYKGNIIDASGGIGLPFSMPFWTFQSPDGAVAKGIERADDGSLHLTATVAGRLDYTRDDTGNQTPLLRIDDIMVHPKPLAGNERQLDQALTKHIQGMGNASMKQKYGLFASTSDVQQLLGSKVGK